MTTYREQREARAERLRGWADKREEQAAAALKGARSIADQIPFGQPILVGHHSEDRHRRDLARIDSGYSAAFEHERTAERMRERADTIEAQAAASIYSDDDDAPERLRVRIARLEARRDLIKEFNRTCRAGAPFWDMLPEREANSLRRTAHLAAWQVTDSAGRLKGFPSYVLSNLSADIRRQRERLAQVERRRARAGAAEEAPSGVTVEHRGGWAVVTFAEKPPRDVLDALKAAGFRWRQGSWQGRAEELPGAVQELAS